MFDKFQDNSDGSETDRDILGPMPGSLATPGTHPVPVGGPSWPSFPTTYSAPPNLGPIYNPAPPPSTYMTFGVPGTGQPLGPGPINQSPSGSSGGGGSLRHTLAASGSGSESDVGGGVASLSISSYPKNLQGVTS